MWRFRGLLAKAVAKGRNDKPKDLDEIDYYTGEVVKLARECGRSAPVNEKILADGKNYCYRGKRPAFRKTRPVIHIDNISNAWENNIIIF